MKYTISKDIDFCFGHRVWVQNLDSECSLNRPLCCRRIHGHGGVITIFLSARELDSQQMVTDFGNLNWLKKFVDDYMDHRFILDRNDPLFHTFIDDSLKLKPIYITGIEEPVGHMVDLETGIDGVSIAGTSAEWYESFFVVDFVPTSENLSAYIFTITATKMKKLAKVVRVDWHETPKTKATFEG